MAARASLTEAETSCLRSSRRESTACHMDSSAACREQGSVPRMPCAGAPGPGRRDPACVAANSMTTRDLMWSIKGFIICPDKSEYNVR